MWYQHRQKIIRLQTRPQSACSPAIASFIDLYICWFKQKKAHRWPAAAGTWHVDRVYRTYKNILLCSERMCKKCHSQMRHVKYKSNFWQLAHFFGQMEKREVSFNMAMIPFCFLNIADVWSLMAASAGVTSSVGIWVVFNKRHWVITDVSVRGGSQQGGCPMLFQTTHQISPTEVGRNTNRSRSPPIA